MRLSLMIFFALFAMLTACGNGTDDNMDQNGTDGNNGDMNEDMGEMEEEAPEDMSLNMDDDNNTMNENRDGDDAMNESGSAYDRGVIDFELDIEFQNGDDWEYDYEHENDGVKASIDREDEEIEDDEAITEIEQLLQDIELHGDQNDEEMVQQIITALDLDEKELYDIELYIEFENGNMYQLDQQMTQ